MFQLIENSVARFALGALKSTPVLYLQHYKPFRSIVIMASNRIANFFLTKLSRFTHAKTSIEKHINIELGGFGGVESWGSVVGFRERGTDPRSSAKGGSDQGKADLWFGDGDGVEGGRLVGTRLCVYSHPFH